MVKEKINELVKIADELSVEHYSKMNFTFEPPPTHRADYISDKWCKIVQICSTGERVYAFVALQDYTTKTLGSVKTGDIHKPAGWKVPAKHARGSVFGNPRECLNYYGPKYLK